MGEAGKFPPAAAFYRPPAFMTELPYSRPARPRLALAGIAFLSAVLVAELALSITQQSQTWNEAYHLLAGYRYWQCSDFGINAEHPPLVKLLASIPLFSLQIKIPLLPQGTSKQEAYQAARKFFYANDGYAMLFRARLAAACLTLLLALLVFEATSQMFGSGPAFLALGLAVFEPNILANGALVTTDLGLTCCLFAAVYAFYRYVQQPSLLTLSETGLTVGLVLSAKHSGILVFPTFVLLASIEVLIAGRLHPKPGTQPKADSYRRVRHVLRLASALLAIAAIAVLTLWAFYAFRFQARPAGKLMTPTLAEYVRRVKNPLVASAIVRLEHWHLLPESYLYGLADVLIVSAGPRPTFLLGMLYPHGRWFYFPAAFLIKSTLGFMALLLLTLAPKALFRAKARREILYVTIPPALYFAFSMTSDLNIGIRHILPVYPFLLVLAAVGAWTLMEQNRRWAYVVAALMAVHVVSSLRSFPHYLAYSNEAWGGPAKTYRLLTDSNVDWGQSLKAAKRYLDRHQITDCWLAYFGSADPEQEGIPCKLLPDPFASLVGKPVEVVPEIYEGTVLVSATQMAGVYWGPAELNPFEPFLKTPPADNIGGSILVFRGRVNLKRASEWSRVNNAWELFLNGKPRQAMTEARAIVALEPRMVYAHYMVASLLALANQKDEARREFQTALSLAQTIFPEYQWYWVPILQAELSSLSGQG